MIRFVPASQGEPLTRELWRLAVPDPEMGATDKMFEVFDDILDGKRWLMVDTSYAIRVHESAVLDGIADILQPWINGAYIENMRGQMMIVYDAFPQLFKDLSLDTAQMIAAGRLPNPEVMP